MEINVLMLHKVVETVQWRMRAVIKAKGGPTILVCDFFFGQAVYDYFYLCNMFGVKSRSYCSCMRMCSSVLWADSIFFFCQFAQA